MTESARGKRAVNEIDAIDLVRFKTIFLTMDTVTFDGNRYHNTVPGDLATLTCGNVHDKDVTEESNNLADMEQSPTENRTDDNNTRIIGEFLVPLIV